MSSGSSFFLRSRRYFSARNTDVIPKSTTKTILCYYSLIIHINYHVNLPLVSLTPVFPYYWNLAHSGFTVRAISQERNPSRVCCTALFVAGRRRRLNMPRAWANCQVNWWRPRRTRWELCTRPGSGQARRWRRRARFTGKVCEIILKMEAECSLERR